MVMEASNIMVTPYLPKAVNVSNMVHVFGEPYRWLVVAHHAYALPPPHRNAQEATTSISISLFAIA